jgi:hypothetical protein
MNSYNCLLENMIVAGDRLSDHTLQPCFGDAPRSPGTSSACVKDPLIDRGAAGNTGLPSIRIFPNLSPQGARGSWPRGLSILRVGSTTGIATVLTISALEPRTAESFGCLKLQRRWIHGVKR